MSKVFEGLLIFQSELELSIKNLKKSSKKSSDEFEAGELQAKEQDLKRLKDLINTCFS